MYSFVSERQVWLYIATSTHTHRVGRAPQTLLENNEVFMFCHSIRREKCGHLEENYKKRGVVEAIAGTRGNILQAAI